MIKIITDSTCSPSEKFNLDNDIRINPLKVVFEDEEFTESEGLYAKIYRKMVTSNEIPKTSQPSLESFIEMFNEVTNNGDEAIVYTISETLSGTYSCACLARNNCINPDKIHILDSQSIGQTVVGYIYETIDMIKKGKNVEQILNYIKSLQKNSAISFIPESFDNLKKNGRIGNVRAVVASLLNIKPIIVFKEGVLTGDKKYIGMHKTTTELIKSIPEKVKRLFIIKSGMPDYFEKFKEKVLSIFNKKIPIEFGVVSPVVGAHVGPSIGLAWVSE